jgi:hypothetical protein
MSTYISWGKLCQGLNPEIEEEALEFASLERSAGK